MVIYLVCTNDFPHDIDAKCRFNRMVNGGRIDAMKGKISLSTHRCGSVFRHFTHTFFNQVEGLNGEGPHGTCHDRVGGNDVICAARMNLRNAQYGGL